MSETTLIPTSTSFETTAGPIGTTAGPIGTTAGPIGTTAGPGTTTTPGADPRLTSSLEPPLQAAKLNEKQKMTIAGMSALLFFILNHSVMYKLVNGLVNLVSRRNVDLIASPAGCPTPLGVLVHAVVFFFLSRAILELPLWKLNSKHSESDLIFDEKLKWGISGTSTLVFIIIGMPWTFQQVNRLSMGKNLISSPNGCPTLLGLVLHTLVFFALDRGTMELANPPVQSNQ
jgi:hypothetical protein